jgi:septum formation protein
MVMSRDVLYVASQSPARQKLLTHADITYKVLMHGSDEKVEQTQATFEDYVLAVAKSKMHSLTLPAHTEVAQNYMFVLTADTLVRNVRTGFILGKPGTRENAIKMLTTDLREPADVVTGCCLQKYQLQDGAWIETHEVSWTTKAVIEFYVDDQSIDTYLKILPQVINCAGAGIVEDHGLSYLKSISGSYSAVIGLPLYELRQELFKLSFKF